MMQDATSLTLMDEAILTGIFCRAMRHAGDALFEMSGRTVAITTPELRRCSPSEVLELAGGPDALVVAVHVGVFGGISGHALLVLPVGGALRMADRLLEGIGETVEHHELGPVPELDEMERSALLELGNVTIAAALNELGEHLGEAIHPTVPEAVIEFAGAVLDAVLLDLLQASDEVLAARTLFLEGSDTVDGTLLVLPQADSLRSLAHAVGVA